MSKVTALSTDAKSIVSAVATNELPSFCEIVNVLELILKSFINVSVSPVILYGVKPELPTICTITSLSPLVADCVTVPPVLNELVSVPPTTSKLTVVLSLVIVTVPPVDVKPLNSKLSPFFCANNPVVDKLVAPLTFEFNIVSVLEV